MTWNIINEEMQNCLVLYYCDCQMPLTILIWLILTFKDLSSCQCTKLWWSLDIKTEKATLFPRCMILHRKKGCKRKLLAGGCFAPCGVSVTGSRGHIMDNVMRMLKPSSILTSIHKQYMTWLLHEGIFHVEGVLKPAIFRGLPRAYVMCNWAQILICWRH